MIPTGIQQQKEIKESKQKRKEAEDALNKDSEDIAIVSRAKNRFKIKKKEEISKLDSFKKRTTTLANTRLMKADSTASKVSRTGTHVMTTRDEQDETAEEIINARYERRRGKKVEWIGGAPDADNMEVESLHVDEERDIIVEEEEEDVAKGAGDEDLPTENSVLEDFMEESSSEESKRVGRTPPRGPQRQ